MSSVFLSRGQEFRVEIPDHLPCIAVDKQRIREVLINLLDNASKYTQEGGKIILRVTENPDGISVEIEDNGLGISPEKKEKLFSLYNISSYKVGSTQGLGVGLALSRMFVEMHGGRIWGGDNPKGQGSIFGFYLPYKSVMP
jgi:signal transduction histidine kinase